jgi:hypothetical protein
MRFGCSQCSEGRGVKGKLELHVVANLSPDFTVEERAAIDATVDDHLAESGKSLPLQWKQPGVIKMRRRPDASNSPRQWLR